jgi:hypothetical protein
VAWLRQSSNSVGAAVDCVAGLRHSRGPASVLWACWLGSVPIHLPWESCGEPTTERRNSGGPIQLLRRGARGGAGRFGLGGLLGFEVPRGGSIAAPGLAGFDAVLEELDAVLPELAPRALDELVAELPGLTWSSLRFRLVSRSIRSWTSCSLSRLAARSRESHQGGVIFGEIGQIGEERRELDVQRLPVAEILQERTKRHGRVP